MWKMFRVKTIIIYIFIFSIYITIIVVPMFYYFKSLKENSETENSMEKKREKYAESRKNVTRKIPVEIWGKASISMYLWKHILKGPLDSLQNGLIKAGNLETSCFNFTFRNGPGIVPSTVPTNTEHLVIVLNGRSRENIKIAQRWLEFLNSLHKLKKMVVVLLGSESCENDWILPHMRSKGGIVDAVFLVYDSILVDNKEFFQWPLGVAEYRGFPDFNENSLDLFNKRPYKANFFGTIYKGLSRELVVKVVNSSEWRNQIILLARNEWIPNETPESRQKYIEALLSSDLTLSPVGMNTECYRIYEALSVGSVPIVEDSVTPGKCDRRAPAPLRLLKQHKAPVIWISNWTNLPEILRQEYNLSFHDITKRRLKVFRWYKYFKNKMKDEFLKVLNAKFECL